MTRYMDLVYQKYRNPGSIVNVKNVFIYIYIYMYTRPCRLYVTNSTIALPQINIEVERGT